MSAHRYRGIMVCMLLLFLVDADGFHWMIPSEKYGRPRLRQPTSPRQVKPARPNQDHTKLAYRVNKVTDTGTAKQAKLGETAHNNFIKELINYLEIVGRK